MYMICSGFKGQSSLAIYTGIERNSMKVKACLSISAAEQCNSLCAPALTHFVLEAEERKVTGSWEHELGHAGDGSECVLHNQSQDSVGVGRGTRGGGRGRGGRRGGGRGERGR